MNHCVARCVAVPCSARGRDGHDHAARQGAQMSDAAVEAIGLRKTYSGDVVALNGLEFSVAHGVVFGLLGPNGAGKSTAVKVLTTLIRPDGGIGRIMGRDIVSDAAHVRRMIGVVAQRSGADRNATGRENLVLQGQIFGMRSRDARVRANQLLVQFRLDDAADRVVRGYSGGMQRRLDVALGLVHRPSVLFLDEPTTGLDPEVRSEMWEEIERLALDGMSVVLTTHYLEEADRLASDLVIVDRGVVIARGNPHELKSNMNGDGVLIEFEEMQDERRVHAATHRVKRLFDVEMHDTQLRARCADGARVIPELLTSLDSEGIAVAAVSVTRPTLDDVYLKLTGRSIRDNRDDGDSA